MAEAAGAPAVPVVKAAAPATGEGAPAAAAATGKKRAAPAHEGAGDAKRRRADFTVGDRGVFFTTVSPAGANNARRDLLRMLEALLEADEPKEKTEGATAGAKLEAELQQLQAKKPGLVLCSGEVAKGTGFLRFAEGVQRLPSEVVAKLLETQLAEYQATHIAPSSRLLCRVLPIDRTCKPFLDDFRKLAEEVLPAHIGPNAEPTVWALEFRARNTNTLKKEAILEVLDSISEKKHKVNLTDPEKCILVEVNPLFCGLSVLTRWAALKKYNLHALTTPEETKKPAPAQPKAAATPAQAAEGAVQAASAEGAAPAKDAAVPAADVGRPAEAAAPSDNAEGAAGAEGAEGAVAVPAG